MQSLHVVVFRDGAVECFIGSHLPLAIVAILILMFYAMLTIFLVAVVMKKIKVNNNVMFQLLHFGRLCFYINM